MLFNSYTFILAFLPLVWLAHAFARKVLPGSGNAILALFSLGFYAWWDVRFLPLLILSIAVNFWLGRQIYASVLGRATRAAQSWLVLGIICNLSLLGFFKYANFFLENFAIASGAEITLINLVLPIGISFFTFQQIAYLIDMRNGQLERYSLVNYALFVSFFPQLIAGPIVHHKDMMPQFSAARRALSYEVALGLTIFIAGLFKKVMIADNLAPFATPVFAAADMGGDVASVEAWGAALAYTFQIYFDFSGYSDMAIGLGLMFGIRLPINFNSPYKAVSIVEFWRRWHMTLSQFLRDYLYIPLGGNRKGPTRRHINLLTTMLLGGLWHGAGWGFVIWGALHGAYLIANHFIRTVLQLIPQSASVRTAVTILGWAVTFLAVVFSWVFFRATTLDGALEIAGSMLGMGGFTVPTGFETHLGGVVPRLGLEYAHANVLGLGHWILTGVPVICLAAFIAFVLPNTVQIFLSKDETYKAIYPNVPRPSRYKVFSWVSRKTYAFVAATVFIISFLNLGTISEFLYFQF